MPKITKVKLFELACGELPLPIVIEDKIVDIWVDIPNGMEVDTTDGGSGSAELEHPVLGELSLEYYFRADEETLEAFISFEVSGSDGTEYIVMECEVE